jgi:hypothetical protein
MANQKRYGSTGGGSWSRDGRAEDLEEHDTINLYAKQTFPRERIKMSGNQARLSIERIVKRRVEGAERRERWKEPSLKYNI